MAEMMREMRWLRYSALIYAFGLALHTVDHFRRGLDVITPEVLWLGNLSTVIGLVSVVLVLMNNRHAPMVAAITGIPIAVGVSLVHFLPGWGAVSDPFPGGASAGVTLFSWLAVPIEVGGAFAMGLIGWSIVRSRQASHLPA